MNTPETKLFLRMCEGGHTEIVKALLLDPRVDPSEHDKCAIQNALVNDHPEIVKLLQEAGRKL